MQDEYSSKSSENPDIGPYAELIQFIAFKYPSILT
jgi:hypothetical protein